MIASDNITPSHQSLIKIICLFGLSPNTFDSKFLRPSEAGDTSKYFLAPSYTRPKVEQSIQNVLIPLNNEGASFGL